MSAHTARASIKEVGTDSTPSQIKTRSAFQPRPFIIRYKGLAVTISKKGVSFGTLIGASRFKRSMEAHAAACGTDLPEWEIYNTIKGRVVASMKTT